MFLFQLFILSWFSLLPLLGMGYAAFLLFGPEYFVFYYVFIGIPSAIIAIILSANQIAIKFLETTKTNSFIFFFLQIGSSLIEAYFFKKNLLEDYVNRTLIFDFTVLAIITFFELRDFLGNFEFIGKLFYIISYLFIYVFHSFVLVYFYFKNIQNTEKLSKSVSFVMIILSQVAYYLLIRKKRNPLELEKHFKE
ncbi:MAG: hypothetical protein ACK4UJ_00535 [Leptonema sp. (in: bacteria)]